MPEYARTTQPKKTVGAYLKAVKALNELAALGEAVNVHEWDAALVGLTGRIVRDPGTGQWSYTEGEEE